jgi:uncharacterized protein DUF1064
LYQGVLYDSKTEAEYAYYLDMRVRGHEIKSWTRQIPVRLEVNGTLVCKMVVDFLVTHNDGSLEYVEKKGFQTRDYKLKLKLLKALFPDIRYTIV